MPIRRQPLAKQQQQQAQRQSTRPPISSQPSAAQPDSDLDENSDGGRADSPDFEIESDDDEEHQAFHMDGQELWAQNYCATCDCLIQPPTSANAVEANEAPPKSQSTSAVVTPPSVATGGLKSRNGTIKANVNSAAAAAPAAPLKRTHSAGRIHGATTGLGPHKRTGSAGRLNALSDLKPTTKLHGDKKESTANAGKRRSGSGSGASTGARSPTVTLSRNSSSTSINGPADPQPQSSKRKSLLLGALAATSAAELQQQDARSRAPAQLYCSERCRIIDQQRSSGLGELAAYMAPTPATVLHPVGSSSHWTPSRSASVVSMPTPHGSAYSYSYGAPVGAHVLPPPFTPDSECPCPECLEKAATSSTGGTVPSGASDTTESSGGGGGAIMSEKRRRASMGRYVSGAVTGEYFPPYTAAMGRRVGSTTSLRVVPGGAVGGPPCSSSDARRPDYTYTATDESIVSSESTDPSLGMWEPRIKPRTASSASGVPPTHEELHGGSSAEEEDFPGGSTGGGRAAHMRSRTASSSARNTVSRPSRTGSGTGTGTASASTSVPASRASMTPSASPPGTAALRTRSRRSSAVAGAPPPAAAVGHPTLSSSASAAMSPLRLLRDRAGTRSHHAEPSVAVHRGTPNHLSLPDAHESHADEVENEYDVGVSPNMSAWTVGPRRAREEAAAAGGASTLRSDQLASSERTLGWAMRGGAAADLGVSAGSQGGGITPVGSVSRRGVSSEDHPRALGTTSTGSAALSGSLGNRPSSSASHYSHSPDVRPLSAAVGSLKVAQARAQGTAPLADLREGMVEHHKQHQRHRSEATNSSGATSSRRATSSSRRTASSVETQQSDDRRHSFAGEEQQRRSSEMGGGWVGSGSVGTGAGGKWFRSLSSAWNTIRGGPGREEEEDEGKGSQARSYEDARRRLEQAALKGARREPVGIVVEQPSSSSPGGASVAPHAKRASVPDYARESAKGDTSDERTASSERGDPAGAEAEEREHRRRRKSSTHSHRHQRSRDAHVLPPLLAPSSRTASSVSVRNAANNRRARSGSSGTSASGSYPNVSGAGMPMTQAMVVGGGGSGPGSYKAVYGVSPGLGATPMLSPVPRRSSSAMGFYAGAPGSAGTSPRRGGLGWGALTTLTAGVVSGAPSEGQALPALPAGGTGSGLHLASYARHHAHPHSHSHHHHHHHLQHHHTSTHVPHANTTIHGRTLALGHVANLGTLPHHAHAGAAFGRHATMPATRSTTPSVPELADEGETDDGAGASEGIRRVGAAHARGSSMYAGVPDAVRPKPLRPNSGLGYRAAAPSQRRASYRDVGAVGAGGTQLGEELRNTESPAPLIPPHRVPHTQPHRPPSVVTDRTHRTWSYETLPSGAAGGAGGAGTSTGTGTGTGPPEKTYTYPVLTLPERGETHDRYDAGWGLGEGGLAGLLSGPSSHSTKNGGEGDRGAKEEEGGVARTTMARPSSAAGRRKRLFYFD